MNRQIQFFNSTSKEIEDFQTIETGKVSLYTCGPTVYDSSHIGHARGMLVWDIVVRFLRAMDYKVTWARNITDIDDKIINKSKELGINPDQLARRETRKFWNDMHDLNISTPDIEPRATECLPEMFAFIQGLMDKGFAYQVDNGDIYFRVKAFKQYGQLKCLNNDDQQCRVDHIEDKENQADFALWKAFSKDEYGFNSPFGHGRPGWHLECSTMIKKHFGQTIDIHGGGEDLIFPHHENEIAQSEALHDCQKFVNYWMHNGMIMINGRKMSKSENNYVTIQDALQTYSSNAIRLFTLTTHYRQTLNYCDEALESAQTAANKLIQAAKNAPESEDIDEALYGQFLDAMCNDMNTPQALAVAFELAKQNTPKSLSTLEKILSVLGFDLAEEKSCDFDLEKMSSVIDLLLELRADARANKDYAKSDKIRDAFTAAGLQIQDSADGAKVIVS